MKRVLRGAVLGTVAALGMGIVHVGAVYVAWRPWGPQTNGLVMLTHYALFLFAAGALITGVGCLFAVACAPLRARAVSVIIASVVALVSVLPILSAGFLVERVGIERVVADAAPLVLAITRYEAETGAPPATLETLVPEYLAAVPSTGASAFPEFHYTTATEERPGRWWLTVPISTMIFDWRHLLYDPDGNHPHWGSRVSGNWALMNP